MKSGANQNPHEVPASLLTFSLASVLSIGVRSYYLTHIVITNPFNRHGNPFIFLSVMYPLGFQIEVGKAQVWCFDK